MLTWPRRLCDRAGAIGGSRAAVRSGSLVLPLCLGGSCSPGLRVVAGLPGGQQRAPQARQSLRVRAVGPISGEAARAQAAVPPRAGLTPLGGAPPPTAAPLPRLPVCPVSPEPAPAPPAAPAWAPVHGPRVAPGRGCLHLGGGCITWGWGARAGLPHAPRTALKALPTDPRAGPRRQGRVPAAPRASHAPQPRARGPHPPRPPSAPNRSQSPAR